MENKTLMLTFEEIDNDIAKQEVKVEIIPNFIKDIENKIFLRETELQGLSIEIDDLTNHSTKLDYAVAVASGFLAALVDIFFVGKFDIQAGQEWSKEKVDSFVMSVAKKHGYKGEDKKGAIRFLEKYGAPSDSVTAQFGGGRQHHLRYFAHHASPIGLLFSMLTQFTEKAYGTNTNGSFLIVNVENKEFIGKGLPEKISLGLVHWLLHLASDMAGSSSAIGKGTGIPGPILSLVKLLGTIPIFKNEDGINQLSLMASKLFNGTLLAERDSNGKIVTAVPMDLRGELAILHQLTKQSIPLIINEALVRGFYCISRLIDELKVKKNLKDIDWKKVKPFKNATLTRMLTISIGVFASLDQLDAVIEGAINSKANWVEFARQVVMRINFVGLARFTVSLGSESIIYYKKSKKTKEEIKLLHEILWLMNAKMYYLDKLIWQAAKDTNESIKDFYSKINELSVNIYNDFNEINNSIKKIEKLDFDKIEDKNPGLLNEILETLK